jgi:vanillate O-demethylase ferredoxin subunit
MLSCEQGMCGSYYRGPRRIPEHRDSVLTAEEKAGNDQITLCCSRAKSPVLVLDL